MIHFAIQMNEHVINTYNGMAVDTNTSGSGKSMKLCIDPTYKERFERKTGHKHRLYGKIMPDDSLIHYFDVETEQNVIHLHVYHGKFDEALNLEEVFCASIEKGIPGIKEKGECDLKFWHELFTTSLMSKHNDEMAVMNFSLTGEDMKRIRKVFSDCLNENPFLFFEWYGNLKKKQVIKQFDSNIFNIPEKKISKYVGKALDTISPDEYIYYAWTSEVELSGEVFIDATVIEGSVTEGIMDIRDKHRFFITDGFIYSPDGGDASVFTSIWMNGILHCQKFQKKYPQYMLEKYDGNFPFMYLFSKYMPNAFEILSKMGLSNYADEFILVYFSKEVTSRLLRIKQKLRQDTGAKFYANHICDREKLLNAINPYGKNDKEIFGFKASKLKNLNFWYQNSKSHAYKSHNEYRTLLINKGEKIFDFYPTVGALHRFLEDMQRIQKNAPYALDMNLDDDLFDYIKCNLEKRSLSKDISYLKRIGTCLAEMYQDYCRMCKTAKLYSGGVYPKHLQSEHDVMIHYMNQIKEAMENQKFQDAVSSDTYMKNVYCEEGEKYCILAPRVANDMVNESYRLRHCVRSYIKDVACGYTKIYFMRLMSQKAKPLITIEVRYETVIQKRGKGNRLPTSEESAFIERWATRKGLHV